MKINNKTEYEKALKQLDELNKIDRPSYKENHKIELLEKQISDYEEKYYKN